MDTYHYIILFIAAFIIGISKTGIQGLGMFAVPLLAIGFGAKPSTGLILPMLCIADIVAVSYYRRKASWKHIIKLLPASIVGFFIALFVDSFIPEQGFKTLLSGCLMAMVVIMLLPKSKTNNFVSSKWYSIIFGLVGGFATMIANAAGPVMAIYLLSKRLPKDSFIGTNAWFFMVINLLKLPLQFFIWENISVETLTYNLYTIPFIVIGGIVGIKIIKHINQNIFYKLTLILTIVSIILLFNI